ncbi:Integumentary mucin A.1 precursor, putative [Perkinsus marinus ATCC 50983]|uniref:Integumentary mucin A.1, putative n=1 Tax=Perkinsus marinus (strain ATCC 50983 / TXsc) TaxID=423536 RepID=C5KUX9_PERM5|nr:Integumentary mucin A.1 precursor, putative [Perkinsus marinus ATCC 50983]EER11694.1 Integumentary mucin A.1 precursor, putative [Perkinsus marinus ATCC 50983]|eukprot:XP_002779899.1 Integumentary mucin A.1 precursor, putative [Perkinsus marinus ATCC 50983]
MKGCDRKPRRVGRAVTTTRKPTTTTRKPTTTTPEPVTTTPEPVTTTAEPVTTTPEPVTTTPEPVTTTAEPVTTTPEPVTTTAEPVTTTAMPESEATTEISSPSQTTPEAINTKLENDTSPDVQPTEEKSSGGAQRLRFCLRCSASADEAASPESMPDDMVVHGTPEGETESSEATNTGRADLSGTSDSNLESDGKELNAARPVDSTADEKPTDAGAAGESSSSEEVENLKGKKSGKSGPFVLKGVKRHVTISQEEEWTKAGHRKRKSA